MRKRVCILGSTGSIGVQALEVIAQHRDRFEVVAIAATGKNYELMLQQVKKFAPGFVATLCPVELPDSVVGFVGEDALFRLLEEVEADIYLVALSGTSGIMPTYYAVKKGKRVALANKESLVSAGAFIMEAAEQARAEIVPVDSEHSAIYQCLLGQDRGALRRVVLTASGGPFLRKPLEELEFVTPQEALSHPTWSMGPKITVDSATMMNKGLEVIEARWLFGLSPERIDVVVHPQAVVHSMVEFEDNSVIAQMGTADMRIPISFALGFPERLTNPSSPLELVGLRLEFEAPDFERFPLLRLAYEVLREERVLPVVLNSADEVAVEAFLAGEIPFTGIYPVVAETVERFSGERVDGIEDVMELHGRAREFARKIVAKYQGRKRE